MPKTGAPKYTKQMLIDLKGEINSKIVNLGNFNAPLSSTDRSFTEKINKKKSLKHLGTYRTFYQKAAIHSKVHMEHSPG